MQIRPLQPADLEMLDEIDATISSGDYLHVDRHAEGLSATVRLEPRTLPAPRIESNPIGDDLRFSLKQVASGIEEGLAMIAEHDGVPIASMLAVKSPDGSIVELVDVRVDSDRRRDGLGSAMIFQAINFAREGEARAIRAVARTSNGPIHALLVKLGFEFAGLDTFRESNHDLVKEQTTLLWYLPLV